MEDWMYLIKDVGFPIAMCLYFVFITNTTIKRNTDAILELSILIKAYHSGK